MERGISGGPLSPEGLGHGGPQESSGTEDGEAGESLEDRSRYASTIEGSLGTRGDTETQSPLLAGGIQVEEGVSAMGSCPSGGNRAAGAAVAEQQGAGSPPPLRALLPARLGLAA